MAARRASRHSTRRPRRPSRCGRLGGELDWDEIERSGCSRPGSATAGCWRSSALRPAGAAATATSWSPGRSATRESFSQLDETLISTEYGPDGRPRRVGLELYPADDGLALRIAGDVNAPTSSVTGGVERVAAALAIRGPGGDGAGGLDTLAPRVSRRRSRAVISDFGGVLTTPLLNSFAAFQDQTGIAAESLGRAMQAIAERDGAHPLYELETGRLTEADVPRAARRRRSSPSSATGPRCTASARSTSRRCSRTSR